MPLKYEFRLIPKLKPFKTSSPSSWIKGVAIDITGEPLPGTKIKLEDQKDSTQTDINGNFILRNLKNKNYIITADEVGYSRTIYEDIAPSPDSTFLLIVRLYPKKVDPACPQIIVY
jgi:hypothetical protein